MKSWFASLKIQQKLALVCVFFVMPDCLMLYFVTVQGASVN